MANPVIIDSRDDLKNALEDHLNRTDVDDEGVSDMLIDLAEARLNREVRHPKMLNRDDSFTVDSQYENVPTGFLSVQRFALNTSPTQILEFLSMEEMGDKRSRALTSSGRPLYYTITGTDAGGSSFEFLPTPETAYTGLLVYWEQIPALTASNTTNWLLDDHPDIYLSACMSEAWLYYMDDTKHAQWEARLERQLLQLNRQGSRESMGATPTMRARSFG